MWLRLIRIAEPRSVLAIQISCTRVILRGFGQPAPLRLSELERGNGRANDSKNPSLRPDVLKAEKPDSLPALAGLRFAEPGIFWTKGGRATTRTLSLIALLLSGNLAYQGPKALDAKKRPISTSYDKAIQASLAIS